MKKTFLLLAVLAGSGRLMAQNSGNTLLITPQPLTFLNVDTALKSPTLTDLTKIFKPQPLVNYSFKEMLQTPLLNTPIAHGELDNMPIAVLPGKSNMPIVKIGGNYNMPVLGKPRKKEQITIVP